MHIKSLLSLEYVLGLPRGKEVCQFNSLCTVTSTALCGKEEFLMNILDNIAEGFLYSFSECIIRAYCLMTIISHKPSPSY